MGYSDFECTICYVEYSAHCKGSYKSNLCGSCVEGFDELSLIRMDTYFRNGFFFSYDLKGVCVCCGKVRTLFVVPTCEEHSKFEDDKDNEDDEDNDKDDEEKASSVNIRDQSNNYMENNTNELAAVELCG